MEIIELNGNLTMLAYVDEIFILGNSWNDVVHTVENLIAFSRKMDLMINEEKYNTC